MMFSGERFQRPWPFVTYGNQKRIKLFGLLDNIFIRFGAKLHRQTVGIPMCTNCVPLVADLFCFLMKEISDDTQADIM